MTRAEILSQINGQLAGLSDDDLEMLLQKLEHQKAGMSFLDAAPQHVRDSVLASIADYEKGVRGIPHDEFMASLQSRIDAVGK